MKALYAGAMRHKITIEAPPSGLTADGTPSGNWTEHAATRGEVVESGAGEEWVADLNLGEVSHVVRTRWIAGVTRAMRVVYDGRNLGIRSIQTDPRRRWLLLGCDELT